MLHIERVWSVSVVEPTQLADKLTRYSWCLCVGFQCEGLLWLNDSTSEDAVQEFAVVRVSDGRQLESVTVSWMTVENIEECQRQMSGPTVTPLYKWALFPTSVDKDKEHRCPHCA